MKFNAEQVKEELIQWIRDFFEENGPGCNAVLGISGGKDSSVAAALCVEALGNERVVGVLMPNGDQRDIHDSYRVVNMLDIRRIKINISDPVLDIEDLVRENLGFMTRQAQTNLPPRIRMATLYAVSQSINGRVVNTGNLSENWIGWSTRWGDSAGDFAPLARLTSDEVVQLGLSLKLPADLVLKPPADGLTGKTDEENFGFTYAELNKYLREGREAVSPEVCEKIVRLHQKNIFKLSPIPSFYYPLRFEGEGSKELKL